MTKSGLQRSSHEELPASAAGSRMNSGERQIWENYNCRVTAYPETHEVNTAAISRQGQSTFHPRPIRGHTKRLV